MTSAAFDQIVVDLAGPLRGFIRRRVRDAATADDLTQETLLKVYRSRAALRDGQRLQAWLYRIARRTVIDHYRRRRPQEELPAEIAAQSTESDHGSDRDFSAALSRSLAGFLEALPAIYREPVRLAELEGLPLPEVARRLGLTHTAVKSRVRRGRALLKKKLQACCRLEVDRFGQIVACEGRQSGCACEG